MKSAYRNGKSKTRTSMPGDGIQAEGVLPHRAEGQAIPEAVARWRDIPDIIRLLGEAVISEGRGGFFKQPFERWGRE